MTDISRDELWDGLKLLVGGYDRTNEVTEQAAGQLTRAALVAELSLPPVKRAEAGRRKWPICSVICSSSWLTFSFLWSRGLPPAAGFGG